MEGEVTAGVWNTEALRARDSEWKIHYNGRSGAGIIFTVCENTGAQGLDAGDAARGISAHSGKDRVPVRVPPRHMPQSTFSWGTPCRV